MGYKILAKNFRTRFGEIDIIAKDGNSLVFVEVKTRHNVAYGRPEEAVTKTKQRHIIAAANIYLNQKKLYNTFWRIDVLAIIKTNDGYTVDHIKNAVTG